VARLAAKSGVQVIAIDIDRFPLALQPTLATSELLVGTRFERRMDLSDKRNFGLLLARLIGWQRIVFLDDDIEIPEPTDLTDAVRLLDSYSAVGLTIDGFPDNSVVCRAYRESGGEQETFVGGGALAVRTDRLESFFPNIYNEDWFYLVDQARRRQVAITGRAVQRPYDPFSERRARSEELGDCLAEGIFALLDDNELVQAVDEVYWAGFLANRQELIQETILKVRSLDRDPVEKTQMLTALTAAIGRSRCITPKLCVDYVQAWQKDRIQWAEHVSRVTPADLAGLPELRGLLGTQPSAA
jgi:glycosyltransferase involved in cell wall biosynthesis